MKKIAVIMVLLALMVSCTNILNPKPDVSKDTYKVSFYKDQTKTVLLEEIKTEKGSTVEFPAIPDENNYFLGWATAQGNVTKIETVTSDLDVWATWDNTLIYDSYHSMPAETRTIEYVCKHVFGSDMNNSTTGTKKYKNGATQIEFTYYKQTTGDITYQIACDYEGSGSFDGLPIQRSVRVTYRTDRQQYYYNAGGTYFSLHTVYNEKYLINDQFSIYVDGEQLASIAKEHNKNEWNLMNNLYLQGYGAITFERIGELHVYVSDDIGFKQAAGLYTLVN